MQRDKIIVLGLSTIERKYASAILFHYARLYLYENRCWARKAKRLSRIFKNKTVAITESECKEAEIAFYHYNTIFKNEVWGKRAFILSENIREMLKMEEVSK